MHLKEMACLIHFRVCLKLKLLTLLNNHHVSDIDYSVYRLLYLLRYTKEKHVKHFTTHQ